MPRIKSNENSAPLNLSRRSAKNFNILQDGVKAYDRKDKLKSGLTKRSALGDVTNKISTNAGAGGHTSLKKPGFVTEVLKSNPEVQEPSYKPSPMCISTDLESMSLDHKDYDIDCMDSKDQFSVWQYADDIHRYYLNVEKSRMVSPAYMSSQKDINSKMRAILIDWLVDVHSKYQLLPQTLHITVNLIDRYLERDQYVPRQRLQLVGVTAMFIASKYEEIYPPEAYDFVRITDNAYTVEEVFEMEETMLKALGYRVTVPTAFQFMKRYIKASGSSNEMIDYFAHYIIDRSLQEYKLLKYPPSILACSAVYIARIHMEELPAWNSVIEFHSSYTESCIAVCVQDLKEMIWSSQNGIGKSSKLTAVRRKFAKDSYGGVSNQTMEFNES